MKTEKKCILRKIFHALNNRFKRKIISNLSDKSRNNSKKKVNVIIEGQVSMDLNYRYLKNPDYSIFSEKIFVNPILRYYYSIFSNQIICKINDFKLE
jgi:hypothetical protein